MATGGDSSSSRRTPATGPGGEAPTQRLVRSSTGLTAASGTSSMGSISGSEARVVRRRFLEFLEETGHQLLLTVRQAEWATAEMEKWRTDQQLYQLYHVNRWPEQMDRFHHKLNELQTQSTQLRLNVGSARARLERLINDGIIREPTLLRPQPKKYTPGCMRAEIFYLEGLLPNLRTSLSAAQAAWEHAFAPWISMERQEASRSN